MQSHRHQGNHLITLRSMVRLSSLNSPSSSQLGSAVFVSNRMFRKILHVSVMSMQGSQSDDSPAVNLELREIRLPE